jgi:hypothetical protein
MNAPELPPDAAPTAAPSPVVPQNNPEGCAPMLDVHPLHEFPRTWRDFLPHIATISSQRHPDSRETGYSGSRAATDHSVARVSERVPSRLRADTRSPMRLSHSTATAGAFATQAISRAKSFRPPISLSRFTTADRPAFHEPIDRTAALTRQPRPIVGDQ